MRLTKQGDMNRDMLTPSEFLDLKREDMELICKRSHVKDMMNGLIQDHKGLTIHGNTKHETTNN